MVQHVNCIGEKYHLHEGLSKKGNPVYWFSKKTDGKLAKGIPKGFEIYENPNGLVYLRRKLPSIISEKEIGIIKESIPKDVNTKVEVKKNIITIYLSESTFLGYQELMRFILTDKETREFQAQRYCFKGSIDDWIELDTSTDLRHLAEKCCFHLGKDSFYDLPYLVDGFY